MGPAGRWNGNHLRGRPPQGPSADLRSAGDDPVLIFDGDCGFCTMAACWAARKFQHGARAEAWQFLGSDYLEQHDLTSEDVSQAAWWVDESGRRERGHRAVGRALEAGGGLRQLAGRLMLVPPVSWLAAGVYRLLVRWRYRLPGGTPACKVDATRPPTT